MGIFAKTDTMIYLILDTNIWLYLAEGQHPFVLNGIIEKTAKKELILLVNDVIIEEWDRNKEDCKIRIEKELERQLGFVKELSVGLSTTDSTEFKKIIQKISDKTPERKEVIEQRYNTVDDLIKNKAIRVPIKDSHKLMVIDWALKKKAPFHRDRNSVADALILISSIDFIKENGINNVNYNRIEVSDSIFVSYNSDDFSKDIKGSEKNTIHPDLESHFSSVGMTYERNFGKILNLSTEMTAIIDEYMDYVESRIIEQMEWENEIKRGK